MKKKVLIGYAPYGSGNRSTAQYIKNYFEEKGNFEILVLDVDDYLKDKSFLNIFNRNNKVSFLQNIFYKLTNNKAASLGNEKLFIKNLDNINLRNRIINYNPDIIICTHFSFSYLSSFYKKEGLINSKIITILTGIKFHKNWIINHNYVDYFIVQNNFIRNDLINNKVDERKVFAFGLPINLDNIMKLDDKEFTLKKYSLSGNRPIYLMFAGASVGYDYIFDYFKSIVKKNFPIDIILITGKNKELKLKCEDLIFKNNIKNVIILGYTKDVFNILNISDVVITKPGSSTLNECTIMKKPVILIPGIKVYESYNAKVMIKNHYALKARSPKSLQRKIKLCLNYPFIINSIKNKLNKNSLVNDSCKKIYDLVNNILK